MLYPRTQIFSNASQNLKKKGHNVLEHACEKKQKVWSDKETELKGALLRLCRNNNLDTDTIHSEAKSALAERIFCSLKYTISKHTSKTSDDIIKLTSCIQLYRQSTQG